MSVTTYLEARYVSRAKLNALLITLFGNNFKVAVSAQPDRNTDLVYLRA